MEFTAFNEEQTTKRQSTKEKSYSFSMTLSKSLYTTSNSLPSASMQTRSASFSDITPHHTDISPSSSFTSLVSLTQEEKQKLKICVTGASGNHPKRYISLSLAKGFIGSHIVHQLLEKGYAVNGTYKAGEDTTFLQQLDKHNRYHH